MIKTISYIAVIALFLGFCPGCKERKAPITLSGTLLDVSDSIINNRIADTFRLGSIKHGEKVVKEFAVRNAGSKPFIINKVDADCGCLVADFEKKPVKPGESTALSVSFASQGYYGYILKRITLMTTASDKPMVFYFEAEIK